MPNILVVENHSGSKESLACHLRESLNGSLEWKVLEAENGDGALKTLFSNNVHLVITSLNAPGISNGGLLSEISTDEMLRDIPVIALADGKGEEKEALGHGVVDFLLTPISDYDVFTAKAINHATRNIRTVNLKRTAEFVALLKDLDNVKNAMAESLTDFGRQMRASAVSVMTKEGPASWKLYLAHNMPSETVRLLEKIENFEPKFFAALSSSRKGISVVDVKTDEMVDLALESVVKRLGAESILGLPLLSDSKVIGCIIFFFETKRSFSEQTVSGLMSTVPGMVYAIENSQKVSDLRSELLTAWKIGAGNLRNLGLFPDEACDGCEEVCDDCSVITSKGFDSVEGVVSFTHALLDRVLDLSSKVDRQSGILEREVQSRTEQLLKEIEERKKFEMKLKQARNELEVKVLERTSELTKVNNLLEMDIAERKRTESALRESEERYRTLIETIPHGIREHDISGSITFSNGFFNKMFGLEAEEALKRKVWDFHELESEKKSIRDYFNAVTVDKPPPFPLIAQSVKGNGEIIDTQVDWNYKHDSKGNIVGFISVITDITERKRAEKALKTARDELEARVRDRTSELTAANEALIQQIAERSRVEEELREARKELEEGVELRTIALQETNEYLVKEVADRKKAEIAVREAHMQTEHLLAAISSIFISVDSDGNVTRWNEAATDTFGIAAEDIVGLSFMGCGIKWDWDVFEQHYLNCDMGSKACRIENMQYIRTDAETGFLALTLSPVAPTSALSDKPPGFILLGSDVTIGKVYQDQLRIADIVYQNTIEGIMVTNDNGIIQSVNPAFTNITGFTAEETIGKKPKILPPSDKSDSLFEEIKDSLASKGQWVGEVWNKRKSGETYPQWLTVVGVKNGEGEVTQHLSVIRDITQIKRAEEELRKQREILMQSEKLAGLGELASGVAHELNQPLNHIKITCQILVKMLEREIFDKGSMIDEVLVIVDNVQRAVEIIQTMRDFARKESDGLSVIDIRQAITNSIKMFGSQLKTHNISLDFKASEKPVKAIGSMNKLGQVIVNMITNARDALESRNDKISKNINISILEENQHVTIRVSDNGPGIPEKVQKDVFNPFFTTKATGVGTGLGLSISYKIIQDFGGSLELESTGDDGTTMKIKLKKPSESKNG